MKRVWVSVFWVICALGWAGIAYDLWTTLRELDAPLLLTLAGMLGCAYVVLAMVECAIEPWADE